MLTNVDWKKGMILCWKIPILGVVFRRKTPILSENSDIRDVFLSENSYIVEKTHYWEGELVWKLQYCRKIPILSENSNTGNGIPSENSYIAGKFRFCRCIYASVMSEIYSVTQIVWSSYIRYIGRNFSAAFLSVHLPSMGRPFGRTGTWD